MLLMWRYRPNIRNCTCHSITGKQWCNRYWELYYQPQRQIILPSIISVTFFDLQILARWNRRIYRQQIPNSGLPRSTTSARRGRRNNINWRKTKIISLRRSNLHPATQLYHSQSLCFSYIWIFNFLKSTCPLILKPWLTGVHLLIMVLHLPCRQWSLVLHVLWGSERKTN